MFLRNISIALILALVTMGYPILASVMSLLGVSQTSFPSVVFRIGVVFLAILALVLNRKNLHFHHPLFSVAVSVFWVGYIFRIIYDSYIAQDLSDLYDPTVVVVTAITFVLIPILPAFIGLNEKNKFAAYRIAYGFTIIAASLMLLDAAELISGIVEKEQVRFRLTKLDSISVGYVGGILLIFSFLNLLPSIQGFKLSKFLLFAIGSVVGLFILLVAGSRGPVVAVVIALTVYWLVPLRVSKLVVGFALIATISIVVMNIHGYLLKQFDLDVSTRFVEAQEGESESIDYRSESFAGAWQQFKDNPLFGDSLFEKSTGAYPHNLVLEGYMATGIIGGSAYVLAILIMLLAAMRLLARNNGYDWLALIGIFYVVASMFSGNHWAFAAHWVSLIFVVTTEAATRGEVDRKRRSRRKSLSRPKNSN